MWHYLEDMRVCKKCGLAQPLQAYTVRRKYDCRDCVRAHERQRYLKSRGGALVQPRRFLSEEEWASENRDKALAYYHQRRKEINNARNRPLDYWFRIAVARCQKANRNQLFGAIARLERRLRGLARKKIIRILRRRLQAAFSAGREFSKMARDLLGCEIPHLRAHLESRWKPGMSWENYGFYGWHIDHIVPCAKFDLSDPEQQKACFHWTNLQPLWAKENLKKRDS